MNKITITNNIIVSIKNGYSRNNKYAFCKYSKFSLKILSLLYKEGLIVDYKIDQNILKIKLKYYKNKPIIDQIISIYKPSLKQFSTHTELKKYQKKYHIFFVSTPLGIISSNDIIKYFPLNIKFGGQVLFGIQLINKY